MASIGENKGFAITWVLKKSLPILLGMLILFGIASQGMGAAQADESGVQTTSPQVETASSASLEKVDPAVWRAIRCEQEDPPDSGGCILSRAGEPKVAEVVVYVQAGTDLSKYMTEVLVRPFVDPLGRQAVFGKIADLMLPKVAALAEVSWIRLAENGFDPGGEVITGPDALDVQAFQEAMAVASQAEVNVRSVPPRRETLDAGRDWWDVEDSHLARQAWARGVTGEGVRVMVNDSGIDFCHPDLYGTWAVVQDPHSPYQGWPMMFDAYSMQLYAEDTWLGKTNTATGQGDYADTRATCLAGQPCLYQPIGASSLLTYTLPVSLTSASGVYHIGSHPDRTLQTLYKQRVAILVVDSSLPGVYDTVFVDLDNDQSFADETPATREQPAACLDYYHSANAANGADGYNDLSGGLVYFIADGVNPIPASDWLWGGLTPGNGDLVAFSILPAQYTSHGQWTATHVAGQGIINGVQSSSPPAIKPPYAGKGTGVALGMAPGARLVSNGNFYYSKAFDEGFWFAALGYDGVAGTADDLQVINNSWGESDTIDKGWDEFSRLVEMIGQVNPKLAIIFATGNGGPGYGTTISPTPPGALSVGAGGLYGSTPNFDSIQSTDQIRWGEYATFSNRGARLTGSFGVDILANGIGYTTHALNSVRDGWKAALSWRGTSKSAPVAAGMVALVYDAIKARTGEYPDAQTAFAILKSSASDAGNDPLSQGAGYLNALGAVDLARGAAGYYVTPTDWAAGSYHGENFPAFANILFPGESATQVFTLTNPMQLDIGIGASVSRLVKLDERVFTYVTQPMSQESSASNLRPDYLMEITGWIPMDADLMEVRMAYPFNQFDPEQDYAHNQAWEVVVLDWTDLDQDGILWTDTDGNGIVNTGEMDAGEYLRFDYDYNIGNAMVVNVQSPLVGMHDGVFIALRHSTRSAAIPTTTMQFQVIFYQEQEWDWITLGNTRQGEEASDPGYLVRVNAGSSAGIPLTLTVPADTPYGMYSGLLKFEGAPIQPGRAADGDLPPAPVPCRVRVPIIVNVAAQGATFTAGGTPPAETPFDNGRVGGYLDWNYRAEVGDWRHFFFDADELPGQTSRLVVYSDWADPLPNDLDTYVYSPLVDDFSRGMEEHFGPYTLGLNGRTKDMFVSGGKWRFNTVGGGTEDWMASPLVEGLNLMAQRQVLHAGAAISVPFTTTIGTLSAPASLVVLACDPTGVFTFPVTHTLALDGLNVTAYGLANTTVITGHVSQDNPRDPSTASFAWSFNAASDSQLSLILQGTAAPDLDLYLLFDANEDSLLDWQTEVVASSVTKGLDWISAGPLQAGQYQVLVHGVDLAGGPGTFEIAMTLIQGSELEVQNAPVGPLTPGTRTLQVAWNRAPAPGEVLRGGIRLGTPSLPALLYVPVLLAPCEGQAYARFEFNTNEENRLQVRFTDHSEGLDLLEIHLDFGDGQQTLLSPGQVITHTYTMPGYYLVTLTAKNEFSSSVVQHPVWVGHLAWLPLVVKSAP